MSHSTKFEFSYQDPEILYGAFTKLGMTPSMIPAAEFNNWIKKMTLGQLGLGETQLFRAMAGKLEDRTFFLLQLEDEWKLVVVASVLKAIKSKFASRTEELGAEFQAAYISAALERLGQDFNAKGVPSRLQEAWTRRAWSGCEMAWWRWVRPACVTL